MSDIKKPFQFENAFTRLEEILGKLNSGAIPLDDSLKLYEEADGLIASCSKKLTQAEQKVEMLIKDRVDQVETTPFQQTNRENV